jgi:hypothetical protein
LFSFLANPGINSERVFLLTVTIFCESVAQFNFNRFSIDLVIAKKERKATEK